MDRGRRELLGRDRLVLDVRDRPGPPPLRFEATDDARRRLLRQGERPLLLGAATGDGCCRDLHLHRLAGYRSPLPPLRSAAMRSGVNRVHQYARWLEDAPEGPLCDGRWELSRRTVFAPGIWDVDLVRAWPGGCLELWCGGGWHGILPLRELSPPDAPRVKAYRKHAREGTLAPVLLWWVSFLDGWAILDGHDRAVAALTEGRTPECVVLTRVVEEDTWRRQAAELTEERECRTARLDARPHPGAARHRALMDEGFAHTLAELPYEASSTPSWPLPGGRAHWGDLAAAAVFQFPSD